MWLFLITRATNVFVKLGTNYILKEKEWKGSINGVCAKLGYDTNQFYTYFPSDDGIKSDINYICFEIFTRDIVCVLCEDNVYELKEQDINNFLKDFDFSRIYSVYNRDTDLSEGIKRKNLNINFLAKALRIAYNKNSTDTVLISDIFKYKQNNKYNPFHNLIVFNYCFMQKYIILPKCANYSLFSLISCTIFSSSSMQVSLRLTIQIIVKLIDNTDNFCNFVLGDHRYICFISY